MRNPLVPETAVVDTGSNERSLQKRRLDVDYAAGVVLILAEIQGILDNVEFTHFLVWPNFISLRDVKSSQLEYTKLSAHLSVRKVFKFIGFPLKL